MCHYVSQWPPFTENNEKKTGKEDMRMFPSLRHRTDKSFIKGLYVTYSVVNFGTKRRRRSLDLLRNLSVFQVHVMQNSETSLSFNTFKVR